MENETQKGMNQTTLGLIAIVVVAVIAVGFFVVRSSSTTNDSMKAEPTQVMNETSNTQETMMEKGTYEDGTYEVVGNYTSPGGEEELGVVITIENNVITDAEVTVLATRPISNKMQTDFAENYEPMVVGKNIDEVNLGKVSGSSLTPKGFNDALEKVKVEAAS